MAKPEQVTIKFMFITASGRTMPEIAVAAGLNHAAELVNEAVIALLTLRNTEKTGEKIVRINPLDEKVDEIENLKLDPSKPSNMLAEMTIPAARADYLRTIFNDNDCAGIMTEAFYTYDRLVSETQAGFEIAVVDDPENITRYHPLEIGHMVPE